MRGPERPDPPERDPALDGAWKAHSTELPPARLDAAILAAAHREARSRPRAAGDDDIGSRARGPSRAWWGLAAAATIGAIAFGIVQMAPEPASDAPVVASDTPSVAQQQPAPLPAPEPFAERKVEATTAQDKAAVPTAPMAAQPVRPTPKTATAKRAEREPPRVEAPFVPPPEIAAPRAIVPAPFPGAMPAQPAAPPAETLAKGEADSRTERAARLDESQLTRQRSAAPPRSEARNAAGAVAALRDAERAPRTPEAWIEVIRDLYAAQRRAEAARELNAFRAAYADADARLPEALRAWATTVKRD